MGMLYFENAENWLQSVLNWLGMGMHSINHNRRLYYQLLKYLRPSRSLTGCQNVKTEMTFRWLLKRKDYNTSKFVGFSMNLAKAVDSVVLVFWYDAGLH